MLSNRRVFIPDFDGTSTRLAAECRRPKVGALIATQHSGCDEKRNCGDAATNPHQGVREKTDFAPTVAGMAGLEPASEGVKVPCLTTWLHPYICERQENRQGPEPKLRPFRLFVGWVKGLEPSTPGTTIRCSNQLSYTHHIRLFDRTDPATI